MNATRAQLVAQYNRAKKLLWTEHFREAANTYTPDLFDTADLMAIASRETNLDPVWLTRKGDNGHGAGLMQIDDRSFPEFTNSTKWKDARLGILYGAKVLRQKWDDLQNNAGKRISVKNNKFTCPAVSGVAAQQIVIAAYNSGRWAFYHYAKSGQPDKGTTGKDYSSDVMQRARVFRELLGKDGMLDKSSAAAPTTGEGAQSSGGGANAASNTQQGGSANTEQPPIETKVTETVTEDGAKETTVETTTFTPQNIPAFIPRFGKQWFLSFIPTGGVIATVGGYIAGLPPWMVFALGMLTGCAAMWFGQLVFKHRMKVLDFINWCYQTMADPTQNNPIPTPAAGFVGQRKDTLEKTLTQQEDAA